MSYLTNTLPFYDSFTAVNIASHNFDKVTGFSVGGRVVDGYGAGVDNATVIVDGQLRAITDSQGYYMLDQVCF